MNFSNYDSFIALQPKHIGLTNNKGPPVKEHMQEKPMNASKIILRVVVTQTSPRSMATPTSSQKAMHCPQCT